MDLYTEDAAVMLPGQATVAGAEQLSAAYKALFGAFAVNETCQFADIRVRGDMAAVRTTSSGTVTARASGNVQSASYRELFVLERVITDWKISHYMSQEMPKG